MTRQQKIQLLQNVLTRKITPKDLKLPVYTFKVVDGKCIFFINNEQVPYEQVFDMEFAGLIEYGGDPADFDQFMDENGDIYIP